MSEESSQMKTCDPTLYFPDLGIAFRRFHSAAITKYVGEWKNFKDSHIYELVIKAADDGWCAEVSNDGRYIFRVHYRGRNFCEKLGKAAMRKYIRHTHRQTLKSLKAEQNKVENAAETDNEEAK